MTCISRQLEDSMGARWLAALEGKRGWRRWEIRQGFFRAAEQLLDRSGAETFGWQDLVATCGSRSGFYAAMAHQPLSHAYATGSDARAKLLAAAFGTDRVVQLIGEAKVWSYWPYRQAWARDIDERDPAAEPGRAVQTMRVALDTWAREHGGLSGALDRQLPVCAVEDLMIVLRRPVPVLDATELLTATAAAEVGPTGRAQDPATPCANLSARSGAPAQHVRAAIAALDGTCLPERPTDWERTRSLLAEALERLGT